MHCITVRFSFALTMILSAPSYAISTFADDFGWSSMVYIDLSYSFPLETPIVGSSGSPFGFTFVTLESEDQPNIIVHTGGVIPSD